MAQRRDRRRPRSTTVAAAGQFIHDLESHFQPRTDPLCHQVPDGVQLRCRRARLQHDPDHNLAQSVLNDLSFANAMRFLEQIVEAHDATAFGRDDIVIDATFDAQQYP